MLEEALFGGGVVVRMPGGATARVRGHGEREREKGAVQGRRRGSCLTDGIERCRRGEGGENEEEGDSAGVWGGRRHSVALEWLWVGGV